jgi:hypothetical protein
VRRRSGVRLMYKGRIASAEARRKGAGVRLVRRRMMHTLKPGPVCSVHGAAHSGCAEVVQNAAALVDRGAAGRVSQLASWGGRSGRSHGESALR